MWESDTMNGRTRSLYGNIYAQVFTNETFFTEIYTRAIKYDSRLALKTFITEIVVPENFTIDFSKEQNAPGTKFMKFCQSNYIQVTRT